MHNHAPPGSLCALMVVERCTARKDVGRVHYLGHLGAGDDSGDDDQERHKGGFVRGFSGKNFA